jgi:hypothetical protein
MSTIDYDITDLFDYAQLDPGIRRLVRLLRDSGFDTCDSGDGVSKFEDDAIQPDACAEPTAHVYAQVDSEAMISEADRLLALLEAKGRPGLLDETFVEPVSEQVVPRVIVEAGYYPASGKAMVSVHGVTDADLLEDA